jgi:histidinol-phosphate aminotransferase
MSGIAPRPGILDITPYVGGESRVAGVSRVIKLASNESALGPSPRAVDAIRAAAAEVHRYPDGGCEGLREALGRRFALDPARIVCGAGSDELIGLLARSYCGPGDEVLYTEHGFLMYPIAARTAGATPVAVPERNLRADVDALTAAVTDRTRILFLANPNNPTGTYLSAAVMAELRRRLPERILLVVDAAYAEYVDAGDYTWSRELVDGGDNVIVTRTFSKIYGLGGVRLGWAYGPPAVIDVLNRVRNPFNVSNIAQAAGIAALADQPFIELARTHNTRWRSWTLQQLRGLGLDVRDTHGNFVLVRFPGECGRDAEAADAYLKSRGLIARRMGAYRLPDALRITIGRDDEMRALIDAFEAFVGSNHD